MWKSRDVSGDFRTERLAVREVERGDLDLLVELNSDVAVMEFLTGQASSVEECWKTSSSMEPISFGLSV